MKVAYVPFNNSGLGISREWESIAAEVIFSAMTENHAKGNEPYVLLLYLSKTSDCFVPEMRTFPRNLHGVDVHVRKKFDRGEGDGIAVRMADGDRSQVVCFRLVPEDVMSEAVQKRILQEERLRFGWAYCLTAASPGGSCE